MVNNLNFDRFKQGSSFIRTLRFKDRTGETPLDLTGYSLRMQIRKRVVDGDLVGEASSENGYFVLNYDGELGTVLLNIPASVTKLWEAGPVVYDCELTYPGGTRIDTVFEGKSIIVAEVTQDAN